MYQVLGREIFVPGELTPLRLDVALGKLTGDDLRCFVQMYQQGITEGRYDNPSEVEKWCDQLNIAANYADTVALRIMGV